MLTVLRRPAEEASLDPHEVAEDDAVADGVATVERAYRVVATSWSHLTEAAVAVEYSLSSLLVPHAVPTPVWHKDVEDNAVEVSSKVRDSW